MKNSANGSTRRWRGLRAAKLRRDSVCELCGKAPATEVDHITPLKAWPEGRFVWSNTRSLCSDCHKQRHGQRPKVQHGADGMPLAGHWWCE